MAKKSKKGYIRISPVTGDNPFEEPDSPRAFTPEIKQRVLFYDV